MTTQTTVATALQTALNPARYQLGIASDKTEGTANTAVKAAITMVDQAEQLAIEQYNKEVDEYNDLCDRLEASDLELVSAAHELQELKSSVDDIKLEAEQKALAGAKDMAAAKVSHSQMKEVREELKNLKAMQPEKLKKKVAEQRAKLDERQKLLEQQRVNIRNLKSTLAESETKRLALVGQATQLEDEVRELRGRMMHHDGEVEQKIWYGSDNLEMYLYTFEWGLAFRPANSDIKIVNDVNWHMEVRTNYGICVLVSVTEWLAPFYPPCDYLSNNWNTEIHDELVLKITERMELSHPWLCERVEWAKENYLEDVLTNEKHVNALAAAGFHSLYSVLHVPQAKLLDLVKAKGEEDDLVKEKTKGFGEAAVRQVYAKIKPLVSAWEKARDDWKPIEIARKTHKKVA